MALHNGVFQVSCFVIGRLFEPRHWFGSRPQRVALWYLLIDQKRIFQVSSYVY